MKQLVVEFDEYLARATEQWIRQQCAVWGHDYRQLPVSVGKRGICVRCGKVDNDKLPLVVGKQND